MTDTRTDICVVGGGPAGLTLALLLARSGIRVVVVERSRSLDREYRGEILQPGGMALLADLGVLDGARARGCYRHDRFQLVEGGRTLLDIDYRRLPPPHNHLLSIPQRHLLAELLAACRRYDHFTYLDGHKVSDLVRDDVGRITGVVAAGHVVRAHCVVAADGRYSRTRRLAGIDTRRMDVFDHDVLWFRLRGPADDSVRIFRAGGNPVMAYRSYPDHVQLGWTLPHRAYADLARHGVGHIKAQLTHAVPEYAELIESTITTLGDLSLLDVFSATARTWVRDGLALIGDAAHSHSPIGAQGINLAIQDAAAIHPILVASVWARDASAEFLDHFAAPRRRDIESVLRIQHLQSRAMLSRGRFATSVRPRVARLLSHTPAYPKILRRIAFGNPNIRVARELFSRRQPCA